MSSAKKPLQRLILSALLFLVVLPGTLFAQSDPYEAVRNQAHTIATNIVENLGAFSIQYALMSGGEIIVSDTLANSQTVPPFPLDGQTFYGIGSTSKMFTTTAIMLLVDQGKIELDEAVTNYLPDFVMEDQRYKDITVRMLLNHSSGLLGSYLVNLATYHDNATFSRELFFKEMASRPLKADPGAFSVYCNDGFTLLELIVEQISNLSFSEFIRTYITKPLALHNTKTPQDMFDLSNLAKTYRLGKATPPERLNSIGTGGIYATAEDLCRFGDIFMASPSLPEARTFLSDQSKKALRNKEYLRGLWPKQEASIFGYGLGWDSVDLHPFKEYGIQALVKGGDTNLYHGSLIVLPDHNLTFAALTSGGSSVLNLLMGQELLLSTLLANGTIDAIPPPYVLEASKRSQAPQEQRSYAGLYANTTMVVRIVIENDGKLIVTCLTDEQTPPQEYYHTESGSFVDEAGKNHLTFVEDGQGKLYVHMVRIIEVPDLGPNVLTSYEFEKVTLPTPSVHAQAAWDARSGAWYYAVNEGPSSQSYHLMLSTRFLLSTNEELPGFVGTLRIIDEQTAFNEVQLPVLAGRDNALCRIVQKYGKEYLDIGGSLFISERDMEALDTRRYSILATPAGGYARWFITDSRHAGKTMQVVLPESGAFAVYGGQECIHYSTVDGNISVVLPQEGKVVFIGKAAGDLFTVILT